MTIQTQILTYKADGLNMVSHFYTDGKPGKKPGIVVYPEAFGISGHAKGKAQRLAEAGYAALACDLHGDGKLYEGLDEVLGLLGPLFSDPVRTQARALASLEALKAQAGVDSSKLAAIGYCFGGTMALEVARSGADVKGVVGFHSGLGTAAPQNAKNIKGKVLVCIGADDPGIAPESRAAFETEMREGKVDWRMNLYGGVVHSFTNPDAVKLNNPSFAKYDKGADERSWNEMIALFNEVFA